MTGDGGNGLDETEARTMLLAVARETEELLRNIGADIESIVEARRDSNNDDEHDPEGATLAYERSQADALRAGALDRLDGVEKALARLDDGTFGLCEVCGEPIAGGRLAARPWATRCMIHA